MKINNLEFFDKPEPEINNIIGKKEIICSAYGNVGKMSGKWTTADGTIIKNTIVNRTGNIFQIKAAVEKTGTYICTIKSETEEINTITRVNIFTRELFHYYKQIQTNTLYYILHHY